MKPEIQLVSGKYFDLLNPHRSEITITDIAHALSNICRYTGHCRRFYSVAQHSVLVSRIVPPPVAMQGLLHDMSEAILGDVSAPLKSLLPDYKRLEAAVDAALFDRFQLPNFLDPTVKHADYVALATERRDLMYKSPEQWSTLVNIEPISARIAPLHPEEAYVLFMDRYEELRAAR